MRGHIGFVMLALVVSGCSDPALPLPVMSPAPSADSPSTDPSDVTYVEWNDAPFSVIASAEADALFEEVTTCTSEEGAYSVAFPASWHTNEGGEAPGCSWFGPAPIAAAGTTRLVALVRPDVPIRLGVARTGLGQIPEHPRILSEAIALAGRDGFRSEDLVPIEPPWWSYVYAAWLDDDPEGWKFTAGTSSLANGDYILNKAVLDRMMATLDFSGLEAP